MINNYSGQVSKAEAIQTDWFTNRGLKVLNYQSEVLVKVKESIEKQEVSILAACPSAGKTLMAIYLIEDYLKQNPTHKVLILAHGTTILRTQFHDSLVEVYRNFKSDFDFKLVENGSDYDSNISVNVCLPQSLSGTTLNKVDLLVVDEAHEFYFAKMVKGIINKTTPKKQLLITGTPSPFIRRNYPIIPVTLNTIFDEGMVSDVYVEIATSSYNFGLQDFNRNEELKSSIHFRDTETKKTLDDLLGKIVDRLKGIAKDDISTTSEWLPTLKKLQKTMFVCKTQTQAFQVNRYFTRVGVNSALSTSRFDFNSLEIERYKKEDDCLVLIVVGRGILGFNYPKLVNVVDMTTSKNVDRVYQLLSRVIRKHPSNEKKLFFKIAPMNLGDYYKYFMTGVLALCDESFFTKFNGKNFGEFKILVRRNSENKFSNGLNLNRNKQPKYKPIVFEGLPVFEFFKKCNSPTDAILNKYAIASIRDVRSELLEVKHIAFWTKERCIESALNYQKIVDWIKNEGGAYNSAYKNGWLEECAKHMGERRYWTKERCIESALNYQRKVDWIKNEGGAYNSANKNGWLEECAKHMGERRYWTKERCIESALNYQRKVDWIKNEGGAYNSANKNGWLEECAKHMGERRYWTKERCIESALNYQRICDWQKEKSRAYRAAIENKWENECTEHMKSSRNVTKEECLKSARKYQSKKDWKENESRVYYIARKNEWFKECSQHMIHSNMFWNKERCKKSASEYTSINQWVKNANSAYQSAYKHGWVNECTGHMLKRNRRPNGYWTKEKCI